MLFVCHRAALWHGFMRMERLNIGLTQNGSPTIKGGDSRMVSDGGPRKISLRANPSPDELAALQIGDVVYLTGTVYTAREGVYMRVLDDGVPLPLDLPTDSAANFHCSPAATQNDDGSFVMGAVTATASFRFSKWIGRWLKTSGAKLIIGKGGMSPDDYQQHFVPNGALSDHGWLWYRRAFGARRQGGA